MFKFWKLVNKRKRSILILNTCKARLLVSVPFLKNRRMFWQNGDVIESEKEKKTDTRHNHSIFDSGWINNSLRFAWCLFSTRTLYQSQSLIFFCFIYFLENLRDVIQVSDMFSRMKPFIKKLETSLISKPTNNEEVGK